MNNKIIKEKLWRPDICGIYKGKCSICEKEFIEPYSESEI